MHPLSLQTLALASCCCLAVSAVNAAEPPTPLAVDDRGGALYMNTGVIPNIPLASLAQCADPALVKAGLP